MVYLIGGAAKSGKTFLANYFLSKRKIAFFQTDYLMMALNKDNRIYLDSDSGDLVVAKILEPLLYKMIKAMLENDETYLIEGVHITPKLIDMLRKEFPNSLKGCVIGYTNITSEEKVKEIYANDKNICNGWYHSISKEEFTCIIGEMIDESKEFMNMANQYEIAYFDINNIVEDKQMIEDYLFNEKR